MLPPFCARSCGLLRFLGWATDTESSSSIVVAAGVISYEFRLTGLGCWGAVIHFDDEVEYFWKKRWSPGKFLFLWSRYFSLAFVIGNMSVFVTQNPSEDLASSVTSTKPTQGDRFFHWQNGGAAVAIITSHIVLELRLYAMYRGIRWATLILFSLPFLEALAVGLLFGLPNRAWGGNEAAPGIGMCADGDIKGSRFEVYYPMTTLIIEVTLLGMSLWQAWVHRGDNMNGGRLIRMLTRGSVFYFICLFWVYLMVQIFWILNIYTLNELSTGFEFAFSAIFANRLMIDLRKMYYRPQHRAPGKSATTTAFEVSTFRAVPGATAGTQTTTGSGTGTEMTEMSEGGGMTGVSSTVGSERGVGAIGRGGKEEGEVVVGPWDEDEDGYDDGRDEEEPYRVAAYELTTFSEAAGF
ncbi:hypothetical protein BDW22DRAFT_1348832 [Trametopsis cervina]|nr:hypothetical protein BDW22DRAFT_1348832 [Trametopsis cervina]